MAKINKFAQAAFETLDELGGTSIRAGALVDAIEAKNLFPENKYNYNYILAACKKDSRFDTSKRGYIGLATGVAVEVGSDEF